MKRFFICETCGNIISKIRDSGVPVFCCGKPMTELVPNSSGAAREKHLPVVSVEGSQVRVSVGEAAHPMTEEHLIQWIYLETEKGGQRKALTAADKPEAVFELAGDKAVAVYAYCNLHGLWKTEL